MKRLHHLVLVLFCGMLLLSSGTPGLLPQRTLAAPELAATEIVVPQAALAVTVDGDVNEGSEYVGSATLPLDYGGASPAVNARLVYDANNLYIGLVFPEQAATNRESSYLSLFLDRNGSRDPLAQSDDVQIRVPFDGSAPVYLVGNGSGGFVVAGSPPPSGPGGQWQVAQSFCASEFALPCTEFRISRTLLGDWSEIDGLALGHFNFNLSGAPADYLAPVDATAGAPSSWALVTYGGASASLPRARISGRILDVALGTTLVGGYQVFLQQGSTTLYETTTGIDGSFSFNVPVPPTFPLTVQIPGCTDCRWIDPVIGSTGAAPTRVSALSVEFPPCNSGTCRYRSVDFQILRPVDRVTISGYSADSGVPPLTLRAGSPPVERPGDRVRILGTNMHQFLAVWLAEDTFTCRQRPPQDSCRRVAAPIIDRAGDGTWIEVEIPRLPPERTFGAWFWMLNDLWVRPGNPVVGTAPWIYGGTFNVVPPDYPELYGFGFDNEADGASLNEFLAVYGQNAYVCAGIRVGDTCAGIRVPDPLYWAIWYPVFQIWIDNANGSCVGMAATSLLMARNILDVDRFNPDVFYPVGYTATGRPSDFQYDGIGGPVFGPPRAADLWAEIRKNHGVQTSSEFLAASVEDLVGSSPNGVLADIRANPRNWVVCMSPGAGSGHCVTPYAVVDIDPSRSNIRIYDNNWPNDSSRVIEIDRSTNRYSFELDSSRTWSGRGIYAIPLSVWQNRRTMPLDLAGIVTTAIFGDADGLYTAPGGGQWGFAADGTPVETIPGAVSLSPLAQPGAGTRTAAVALPLAAGAPDAQIVTRGGDYLFFAAQGGNILQLDVRGAAAGASDDLALQYDGGNLRGFRYAPDQVRDDIEPRIGMALGERTRLLFRWDRLLLPASGGANFSALPDARGVEFRNDTGTAVSYDLTLEVIDGDSGTAVSYTFGPFDVPAGAIHRVSIADWPASTQLTSTYDLNGDGTPERSETATGVPCTAQDTDGDGAPDRCVATGVAPANTIYLPFVVR